jgi:hypothetical protein
VSGKKNRHLENALVLSPQALAGTGVFATSADKDIA